MASKVVQLVTPLIEEKASEIGVEVVEIEYAKKVNGYNLTVYIDKPEGVDLELCEKLHTAIDAPLDELDPTEGVSYILNVSSCGLDRPLRTTKDFLRKIGTEVEIKFYSPYKGKKLHCGKIINATDEILTLDEDGENVDLEVDKIAVCIPKLEF